MSASRKDKLLCSSFCLRAAIVLTLRMGRSKHSFWARRIPITLEHLVLIYYSTWPVTTTSEGTIDSNSIPNPSSWCNKHHSAPLLTEVSHLTKFQRPSRMRTLSIIARYNKPEISRTLYIVFQLDSCECCNSVIHESFKHQLRRSSDHPLASLEPHHSWAQPRPYSNLLHRMWAPMNAHKFKIRNPSLRSCHLCGVSSDLPTGSQWSWNAFEKGRSLRSFKWQRDEYLALRKKNTNATIALGCLSRVSFLLTRFDIRCELWGLTG